MDDDAKTPTPGTSVPLSALAGGAVRRVGAWTVGLSRDEPFAVDSRCRHQLADLSKGSVDADGCLVCPWHGARYDVRDGRMVQGPRGFFGYHGPSRGYRDLVKAYARFLPLRRRPTSVRGDRVSVGTDSADSADGGNS
ncbi:Rieske (2Fe-2S) protein [Nocardioides sp. AX2bis]|uniref:Rieske (2Fe-2S) protein n=1 Tax=Nocardioides sp. AX2bis TaxID=2653157 RepID=UPI0012F15648|nr:Rieske (2Fe-2S) protein [Nocardioides sp. AX2bis]VXB28645.1 Ferredoxin subunit of nitrite reductase or a ring-hydroxylating dioxygenase [Nocardioides sp. AX2bis]